MRYTGAEDKENRKEIMSLNEAKTRSDPIRGDCDQNFHTTKRRGAGKTARL